MIHLTRWNFDLGVSCLISGRNQQRKQHSDILWQYWWLYVTQIYLSLSLCPHSALFPLPACIGDWNKSGRGWDRMRAKRMPYFLKWPVFCLQSRSTSWKHTESRNPCAFKIHFIFKQGQQYFFLEYEICNSPQCPSGFNGCVYVYKTH